MQNIGKRRDGPEIEIALILRGSVASALLNAALARKVKLIDLLADVIEAVCEENLFAAVVDV
jgi:hypothetical protein